MKKKEVKKVNDERRTFQCMPNFIRLNIVLNHILWARLHSWDNAQAHTPEVIFQTAQMTILFGLCAAIAAAAISERRIQSATEKKWEIWQHKETSIPSTIITSSKQMQKKHKRQKEWKTSTGRAHYTFTTGFLYSIWSRLFGRVFRSKRLLSTRRGVVLWLLFRWHFTFEFWFFLFRFRTTLNFMINYFEKTMWQFS